MRINLPFFPSGFLTEGSLELGASIQNGGVGLQQVSFDTLAFLPIHMAAGY